MWEGQNEKVTSTGLKRKLQYSNNKSHFRILSKIKQLIGFNFPPCFPFAPSSVSQGIIQTFYHGK